MPDAELRRQRAAYRRGIVRASATAGAVMLAMAGLTGFALHESRKASQAAGTLRTTADTLRKSLYVSDMNLAFASWYAGDPTHARGLLETHKPRPGEVDLRGFEWRYLWPLCQPGSIYKFDRSDAAAFSPDGRTLAVGGGNGVVTLWDVKSPRKPTVNALLREPPGRAAQNNMAFSRDGRILAVAAGESDGSVTLWDAVSHASIGTLPVSRWVNACRPFALAPDGKTLVAGITNNALKVWDVASRQVTKLLPAHESEITSAAFSPDGKTLAASDTQGRVTLWEVGSWRERPALQHPSYLLCLAFSPDGRTLAVGCGDFKTYIWDLASGKRRRSLPGHKLTVVSLAFSRDGKTLATGGMDQIVKLWDTTSWRDRMTLVGHTEEVDCVAFSPDGRLLATGGDHTVRLWDTAPKHETPMPVGQAAAFSPDGRTLAVSRDGTTITLWDVARQKEIGTLRAPEAPKGLTTGNTISLSPDGRMAVSYGNHPVQLWRASSKRAYVFKNANQAAFSPDGSAVAVGVDQATAEESHPEVVLRNVATQQRIAAYPDSLGRMAFSPDGKALATARSDGKGVDVWDVVTQQRVHTVSIDDARPLVFSPDGRTLVVVVGVGQRVIVVDLSTKDRADMPGHIGYPTCAAFSPDGRTLATGSGDHTIKLWNLATHQEVATLRGHAEWINTVAFSPDGTLLASADNAGKVRLWHAPSFTETDR
jgi:WD40 repeat protein